LPKLLPPDFYDLTEADKARAAHEEVLGMLPPPRAILNRVAKPVDPKLIKTPVVQQVVERLLFASGAHQENSRRQGSKRMLVGLAAPQIGESVRIVVVDTRVTSERRRAGQLECFINPEIIWRSRETDEGREGCFSAGPVWGLVRRSIAVKIRAFTPDGKEIERIYEGFTARIIQHEIDHLDGIRFPDRITSDKKRHWVHAEEIALYPENIHNWHRLCTKERWAALKSQG
jgi:peptide deformylase